MAKKYVPLAGPRFVFLLVSLLSTWSEYDEDWTYASNTVGGVFERVFMFLFMFATMWIILRFALQVWNWLNGRDHFTKRDWVVWKENRQEQRQEKKAARERAERWKETKKQLGKTLGAKRTRYRNDDSGIE